MLADDVKRKKEGFQGQKAIVIPKKILISQCEKNEIISSLYITDIGYYPKAEYHYRERPHGADQHILIYCVEGKGWARIAKTEYNIQAGDFFLISQHTAHTYAANERDPWTIYWIHFKGRLSDAIVSSALKRMGDNKGFVHYNEERVDAFNNMYTPLERGYGSENLMYVNMKLWHYLTTFIFSDKTSNPEKFSKSDIIGRAIDFMSKTTDRVINLDEIAQTINLSPSHFSSLFKKKTGFSPIEYFNHLKMQKACQFLQFSDMRIKEIADQLGIDDPYYFSRLFTKIMGMSPNEYRGKKKQ